MLVLFLDMCFNTSFTCSVHTVWDVSFTGLSLGCFTGVTAGKNDGKKELLVGRLLLINSECYLDAVHLF